MEFVSSKPKVTPMPKSAEQQITTVDRKDDRRVIAIVGRPNVGKSALFNRLIGRKTAIVHDQPGVTRDRLKGTFSIGDRSFTLWDTGGIGGAGESQLIAHVRKAVESAMSDSDLLLFLVDAQHGLSPIDEELGRWLRRSGKPVMLVINKIDHPKHEDSAADFASLGFGDPISVSAAHGRGMADLLEEIQRNIPDNKSPAIAPASSDGFPNELDIARTRSLDPVEHKPLSIAIVGRPNVGKSSLINAITKTE
jgi:GTP-binding protein